MTINVLTKIRLTFLVVFLLGAGLSTYVYYNGRALLDVSGPLVGQQLPALQIISRLQLQVAASEPILYEYYASVDREAFLKRYESNQKAIQNDMEQLEREFAMASGMVKIRAGIEEIAKFADELDAELRVYGSEDKSVDWDRARELLAQVSKLGSQVNGRLNLQATSVHRTVNLGSAQNNERVKAVVTAVLVFSGLIAVMAAFLGAYVVGLARRSAAQSA